MAKYTQFLFRSGPELDQTRAARRASVQIGRTVFFARLKTFFDDIKTRANFSSHRAISELFEIKGQSARAYGQGFNRDRWG